MSSDVPALIQKGLTEKEAGMLSKWIEDGKPGLSKYKAERLGEVYCLGYDCEDLHKWFPEYPIEIILFARIQYNWDDTRAQYRKVVQQETLNAAIAARMESIRFLADVVTATHVKFRREILKYIADPDNNKVSGKIIPDNIHSYGYLMSIMKEMITPNQDKNKTESAVPLVTVNVNSEHSGIVVSEASQDDIKKALMKDK